MLKQEFYNGELRVSNSEALLKTRLIHVSMPEDTIDLNIIPIHSRVRKWELRAKWIR